MPGRDIAQALGKTDFQYGVAQDSTGQAKRLVFANPGEVDSPRNGARIGCGQLYGTCRYK